jgi:hypothetical protein
MPRELKKIIFWTPYEPEHIVNPSPKPYPGIITAWDIHPALGEWENELLWILNNDFNLKAKGAKKALRLQTKVREWADEWIKNPDPESFSKRLTSALRPFHFQTEITPASLNNKPSSTNLPPLSIKFNPRYTGTDPTPIWLFSLAWTLTKVGPKGFGKCDICGNYFIDIMHRGKKRCTIRCSRLAATRRVRENIQRPLKRG